MLLCFLWKLSASQIYPFFFTNKYFSWKKTKKSKLVEWKWKLNYALHMKPQKKCQQYGKYCSAEDGSFYMVIVTPGCPWRGKWPGRAWTPSPPDFLPVPLGIAPSASTTSPGVLCGYKSIVLLLDCISVISGTIFNIILRLDLWTCKKIESHCWHADRYR